MRSTKFFFSILWIIEIRYVWSVDTFSIVEHKIEQQDVQVSSTNMEWTCTSDLDCTASGSSCVNQSCQCQPHYVFNAAMTSCLKAVTDYDEFCEETSQCTALLQTGGLCDRGRCTCSKGYYYIHGQCHKAAGLNEKCRTDDDCYVNFDHGALSCRNQVCDCSDGYYLREYRTCRLEAKESGAECTIHLDCTYDPDAYCKMTTSECYVELPNNTTNYSQQGLKYQAPNTDLVDFSIFTRKQCTNQQDCEVLGEAFCDLPTGMCMCKRGYYPDSKLLHCFPEIGEKCEKGDISIIPNAICRFGQWSCRGATVSSENNRFCRKATTWYGEFCIYNEQCYVFGPDAFCKNNQCLCNNNSHYETEKMFCWKNSGIGEKCAVNEDCYVPGFGSKLTCNNEHVCSCPNGKHVNAAQTDCVKDVPELGDPCTAEVDCRGIQNSMCFKESCSCVPTYFEFSGQCVAGIGAPCEADSDCKTGYSTCASKNCSCIDTYIPAGADLCVQGVPYGGHCQYDAECLVNTTKSLCDSTGKCSCDNNHHYRDGRCYRIKHFGEICDFLEDECWDENRPDSMSCDYKYCWCNDGFKPSYNFIYCERIDTSGASQKYTFLSWLGLVTFITKFTDFQ